ncbi:MAG: exopolysaccharide biosynthesis polyprenyl glycosylphosphotransferase [Acidobacteriota bacterium]
MLSRTLLSSNRITRWQVFACIHFALDVSALLIAWYVAIAIRVNINPWMPVRISAADARTLVPHPLVILALWTMAAWWTGLYKKKKMWSAAHAIRRALEADIIACGLAIVVTFFTRGVATDISRSLVFLYGPVSLILLVLAFYSAMFLSCTVQRRWLEPKRVAVLGAGEDITEFVKNIEEAATGTLKVTGVIVPETGAALKQAVSGAVLPVLGSVRHLAEVINRERLDQLICMSSVSSHDFELCGAISNRMGVTFSRSIALPVHNNVRFEFSNEYGFDLLDAEPVQFTHRQEIVKRCMDVCGAAFLLLLLAPLLLALAVLIRFTSPGPVLYLSPRVGKGGRHFMFWKFRSMYVSGPRREELRADNERSGHIFKMRDDPRVTPLGRVMRRFSLDELPQLTNVLLGEMSLVGPRPLPAEDMDPDGLSREYAAWAEQRVQVRPGITGMWQIRGRSDLSFEQMVEFDLDYIRNRTLGLDIRILLETPLAVFSGRGAY